MADGDLGAVIAVSLVYKAIIRVAPRIRPRPDAAFDAHLLGVDPDFRIHISRRLLTQNDGHMLDLLKKMHGEKLNLPERVRDRPDRDRLLLRFDVFRGYE